MKKRIISLAVCCMMLLSLSVTVSNAAYVEYIKDGGFEDDIAANSYTSVTGSVAKEAVSGAGDAYSGEKALKLTATAALSGGAGNYFTYRIGGPSGAYNGFKPVVGESYTASVWVKADAPATVTLKFVSMNVGTNNIVKELPVHEWTKLELEKQILSENANAPQLRLEINNAADGAAVYIDELSFTRALTAEGTINMRYHFTSSEEQDTQGAVFSVDPSEQSSIPLAWPTRVQVEARPEIQLDYGELMDAVSGELFLAVYDGEGVLTRVEKGHAADGAMMVDGLGLAEGYSVKTFLWNSSDTIEPIVSSITAVQEAEYTTGFDNNGAEIFYSGAASLTPQQDAGGNNYLKIVQNVGWAGVQTLADLTRLPEGHDYKISFDVKPEYLGEGNTFRISVRYKGDNMTDGEIAEEAIEYTQSSDEWQRVEFNIDRKTGREIKGGVCYPYQLRMVFSRQGTEYAADKANEIHIDNLRIEIAEGATQ